MFKPNIRGYPRASLRPGLSGWLSVGNPGQVFKYRFPWRRSWIHLLLADPQAQPLLARSGYVHVRIQTSIRVRGGSVSQRPITVFLTSSIVALAALLLWPSQDQGISKTSTKDPQANASVSETTTCQQALEKPKQVIADWISGQTSLIRVQEKDEIILGGVRSNILTLTCDDLYAEYRVTFVRVKDIWQLKNLVQLEN